MIYFEYLPKDKNFLWQCSERGELGANRIPRFFVYKYEHKPKPVAHAASISGTVHGPLDAENNEQLLFIDANGKLMAYASRKDDNIRFLNKGTLSLAERYGKLIDIGIERPDKNADIYLTIKNPNNAETTEFVLSLIDCFFGIARKFFYNEMQS